MATRLDALFYPYTICLDPVALRFLLLLYDRILYLPIDNLLNRGHEKLSRRWSMYDTLLYSGFGTQKQTERAGMYASESSVWDKDMQALMADYDRLEADGICVALRDKRIESPNEMHPLTKAVDEDLADPQFIQLATSVLNRQLQMPNPSLSGTAKGGGVMIRQPRFRGAGAFAEITSQRLNSALLFAEAENVVPVGTHPAFTRLLNSKLHRVLATRPIAEDASQFPRVNRARFSALSWE